MEACRACLSTEEEMVPLNDAFVAGYNLLTDLKVALLDAMPQFVCQSCSQTVKFYVEFRERCITTETSLQEVLLQKVKSEDDTPLSELKDADVKIKQEVKEEECANFDLSEAFFDDELFLHVKNENSEDIKQKKRKHKKRKSTKDKRKQKEKSLKKEKQEPETNKVLSCGLCEKTFTEFKELSEHIESHKDKLTCGLCSTSFKLWPTLVGHRFSHISQKEFRCHVCKKALWSSAFSAAVSMEYHYMNNHYDGEKAKLICKTCFRTYDTPRKLSKHTTTAHSKNCFICDYCNKTYNNKQRLQSHIRCHSDNRTFVCELCGFASKHSGGLKDHKIRKHAPTKVKCKECMRWFATVADRDKHVCNVVPKICPICGLQLNLSRNFNRHMNLHSTVKRYKCSRCPAAYKSKSALIAHNNRHDGIRPMQCPYCPQKFYTLNVLIKHKRIHTGEKPYVCKVCHKGFTGNNNLKVHMKVHGEYLVVKRNNQEDAPVFPFPALTITNYPTPDRLADNQSIELD